MNSLESVKDINVPFFSQKENIGRGIVLAGIGGLAIWQLSFIVGILALLTKAMVMGIIGGVAVLTVTNNPLKNFIKGSFNFLSRSITQFFVETDPITCMKLDAENFEHDVFRVKEDLLSFKKHIGNLKTNIAKNLSDITNKRNLIKTMEGKEEYSVDIQKSQVSIGKLLESNERLSATCDEMEAIEKDLKRMYDGAEITLYEIKEEIRIQEAERPAMMAAYAGYKKVFALLNDSSELSLYNRALGISAAQYSIKINEIRAGINMSRDRLTQIDAKNNMYIEKANQYIGGK